MTLDDRLGGPQEDESDWQPPRSWPRGANGACGRFCNEHRYQWIKATRATGFRRREKVDALQERLDATSGDDPSTLSPAN